ncbi:MAG: putative glycoside hydrolase [Opitutaceae bacterium]
MNKLRLFIFFWVVSMASALASINPSSKADFYVSTVGSDSWSGTLAEPNFSKTDGPFATLEAARDAVRVLKQTRSEDLVVWIRGGVYHLENTVVFGLEDSGVGDSTITYAAYPGETPAFSSGWEVKGWEKVTQALPGLPKAAEGQVWATDVSEHFKTLYDSSGLMPRARSAGFNALNGSKTNLLRFPKGRLKAWSNLEAIEIFVRPTRDRVVNLLPLASVEEEAGVARTTVPATYGMNRREVWVENVLEALDEPGEWVLDTKQGTLYAWPRIQSPVYAPKLVELIRVEGLIDEAGPQDVPVRNLHFRGLTFMCGDRYTVTANDAGLEHDWDMLDKGNALVRFRGVENSVIDQCHFRYGGSGAIRVDLHGIGNRITNNHIEQMGGGGILLCGYGPGTKDVNKKNLVYNNYIHHVGEIYWHSPGIFLWQSGENRVANNRIHDTNYSGMILSGGNMRFFGGEDKREQKRAIRWHEIPELPSPLRLESVQPYLHSGDNVVELNEVHHVMIRLDDGQGIYVGATDSGNVVRRNYLHHLGAETAQQSGDVPADRSEIGLQGAMLSLVSPESAEAKPAVAERKPVSRASGQTSLRISDGSTFVPQDFFPKFSWDKTPVYYMFGDKNRLLSREQVNFIAERTDFLCIEKSHGMKELGFAELGAKHEAKAFKRANPDIKVLFYFNAALAWPYTSYCQDFTKDKIDSNSKMKDFLINDPKTGELADKFGSLLFDVLNPDFREWWVDTVVKGVRESGCDGAFIDQMHGNANLVKGKENAIAKAVGEMMTDLKERMGDDKIFLANNAYAENARYVYPVSDAIMFENYATSKASKESLLSEWEHMLKNAKDGKISVFRLGVEGTGRRNLKPNMPLHAKEKAEFALACYLIGAQPYSYFMYSWGWKLSSGALVDIPEFHKPLGPPRGAYVRTKQSGWEFTREFEHASVWVNTETREAKIDWRD